jgi:hypothetical protein
MGATGPPPGNESGYIHDAKALVQMPPPFNVTADEIQSFCQERDAEYQMLTEYIKVNVDYDQEQKRRQRHRRPQFLCLVYTISDNHPRIQVIRETWAQKCDGFLAASTETDPSLNTVSIWHQGPEEYNNMWQKVRSMWAYVYDNYYEDYDWFHMGGDDMYVIVENLRKYLESDEIHAAQNGGLTLPTTTALTSSDLEAASQVPLYLGKRMRLNGHMDDLYNTGGPGYTLNRAALKRLVVDGLPHHFVNVFASAEDLFVARTLKAVANTYPYESRDEYGRERFLNYPPAFHYPYIMRVQPWHDHYSMPPLLEGYNHSAPESIAFHYVHEQQMKRLHCLLYHKCPE